MPFSKTGKISWASIILIAMIFIAIGIISLMATVPPVSRDALTHHLAIPKLYLQHGGIYEIAHYAPSYYPMNLDLLYLIALFFKNDIIPKFIHFTFALLTAGLIFNYLKVRLTTEYAMIGSLFFLTIPVIVRLSTTAYVDLGLIFFLFLSLLLLLKWLNTSFSLKPLIYSAICCGFAMGTKYNGLIGFFLFSLFIIFIYSRHNSQKKNYCIKSIGHAGLFVVVALIVFSPWMIRNFKWTGNPLYPLYNSIFNRYKLSEGFRSDPMRQRVGVTTLHHLSARTDSNNDEVSEHSNIAMQTRSTKLSPFQIRRQIYGEPWLQILLIPLRVFFQGQDDNPKFFDGRSNLFLLLLPLLAFCMVEPNHSIVKTEKLTFLFFSVLFLLVVFFQTDMRIRYISPILPPLVVLSMFGLKNIKTILKSNIRMSGSLSVFVVSVIVVSLLGINFVYICDLFKRVQPIEYLAGKISRDEYIQQYRPEYASFQYANKHLKADDKILAIYGGNRGYYADRDVVFSIDLLSNLAKKSSTPEMLLSRLSKDGFTHLLINFKLFKLYANQQGLQEKKLLADFFAKETVELFSKDGYILLQLKTGQI